MVYIDTICFECREDIKLSKIGLFNKCSVYVGHSYVTSHEYRDRMNVMDVVALVKGKRTDQTEYC